MQPTKTTQELDNFFPTEDYEVPVTSNYMRFQEGENVFRALSSAITGYEYFNSENKPIRSKERPESTPDIKKDGAIKHFWAFVVWNENAQKIQILEITQTSIMNAMTAYVKNPKWGNPKRYDFIVAKTGNGMSTEYAVTVNPAEPLAPHILEKYENTHIDLEALYVNGDPFTK